jgi:hypothetical protein
MDTLFELYALSDGLLLAVSKISLRTFLRLRTIYPQLESWTKDPWTVMQLVNGFGGLIVVPDMLNLMDAINLANDMSIYIIKNEHYDHVKALESGIMVLKNPKIFLRNGEHTLSKSITLHPLVSMVGESRTLTTLVVSAVGGVESGACIFIGGKSCEPSMDVAINMFPTSSFRELSIEGNSSIHTFASLVYPNTPVYRKFADWATSSKNYVSCGSFNRLTHVDSDKGYVPREGCYTIEIALCSIYGTPNVHPR